MIVENRAKDIDLYTLSDTDIFLGDPAFNPPTHVEGEND